MKYQHLFKLIDAKPTYRIYKSDDNYVRLDFLSHCLRVAMYKEKAEIFPTYTICPGDMVMPRHGRDKLSLEGLKTITPTINNDTFHIDDVTISIDLMNFRISYFKGEDLLFQDREYISYNFEHELGNGSTHYLSRYADEEIFGLGDKTGNINKNKRHFRMETSDAMGYDSRSSDPLYKQIPFYICRNKIGSYGIYYDTYSNGDFDFGQEINNYYSLFKSFKCEEETLVYYVFFGEVEDILKHFSYLTGRDMFPPLWTLKYCGSTMTYTDANDADYQLRKFVELCKKYDLDCGGFYLSSGYTQKGEKRYVFNWNKDKIPNPKELSKYFKDNGIEMLPNVKPAFLSDHFLYQEIAKKGWFLHYKDGTPALFPFWSGYGAYLDFTNDEAFDFWTECIKNNLVDLGYKNIWNDNNEYDIHDENVYACGFGKEIKAILIKPLFSLLMTMSSLEAQDTTNRHMSVTRSGVAGLSRIAETWTGDNNTSFEEFRGNHKIAMTMSLSGLYNFGQDIGGFAGSRPDKELFLRWIQYGVFTPRFTLHSWNPDNIPTMPWLYEDEMKTVKDIFNLRKELMPYLYNAVYKSVKNYQPIIYPIFLKYPNYDVESDAFFFGDDIIALPIFDQGNDKIHVELPSNNGVWYLGTDNYENQLDVIVPLRGRPKYLIKGGSIIPVQRNEIEFDIYSQDEGIFNYEYFTDDGISNLSENKYKLINFEVISNIKEVIINVSSKVNINLIDKSNRKLVINIK